VPTFKLTLAYDGTDFSGWQKQEPPEPSPDATRDQGSGPVSPKKLEPGLEAGKPGRIALRTVQAILERAVREVVREPVNVQGASRTDAGVHARSQVAVFTCSGEEAGDEEVHDRARGGWPLSRGLDRLLMAVNSRLPGDVQIVRVESAGRSFDPIGDCVSKGYSYGFWAGPHRPLWERRYVWHTWADLDLDAMRAAAAHLIGEHDFASFAAAGHGRFSTVREIYACDVHEREPIEQPQPLGADSPTSAGATPGRLLRIDVSGNGFLYNMVRIIAGTLHEVGRGKLRADDVPEVISSLDRRRAGPTLPPEGLCLEWIRYRQDQESSGTT
jgi:tRNA pseudouridine38-40 synthase